VPGPGALVSPIAAAVGSHFSTPGTIARGWSNAEIAERLYLSPATAKTHVGRLLTKLQARDRTQLVVIAYETGLVAPSGP
jgi:hypothetical protein